MPDEQFTRCPSCRTVFRVTQAQLDLRAGQVRCGHCHTVFDGVAHLVSLAPPPPGEGDDAFDEAALGPPTVTLRSARALEPAPPDAGSAGAGMLSAFEGGGAHPARIAEADAGPADATGAGDAVGSAGALAATGVAAAGAGAATAAAAGSTHSGAVAAKDEHIAADPADRSPADPATAAADGAARRGRRRALLYGAAIAGLVLLLAGQAIFHFRDAIAARFPAVAPLLTKACAAAGCTVGPPHEIADLAIQASDLQADSAHKGLLVLTATIRNRSARTLAYPHLELSLTDAQDQVVVRRAFPPVDYAGGTADLAAGIPANAEVAFKMFIDASATTQAGYRLYLFYL